MREPRRRSILCGGWSRTLEPDWTAVAFLFGRSETTQVVGISFARILSPVGLTILFDEISRKVCQVHPVRWTAIEQGTVLTLFWSREGWDGAGKIGLRQPESRPRSGWMPVRKRRLRAAGGLNEPNERNFADANRRKGPERFDR
jgi:hypothetical protein